MTYKPARNLLGDDHYLDVLLEWGTIADIPRMVAEIRRLRADLEAAEKTVETLAYQLRQESLPKGQH